MPDTTDQSIFTGMPPRRPFTFDRVVRIILTIGVIVGVLWLIKLLKAVLLPFLVGWLIAYILEPIVKYNKRLLRCRKRFFPVMMALFETVLILCTVGVFVVPSIIEETHQMAEALRNYPLSGPEHSLLPVGIYNFLVENIDFQRIASHLTSQDIQSILDMASGFIAGSYDFVMAVFNWFIVLLYMVFIMLDYERLSKGFRRLVLPKYRPIIFRISNDVKHAMNQYFRGQGLVAFIVGILFSIGFLIIGLPMAIVLGLFIGVLNMVPYLQLISLLPATLLCLVHSVNTGIDFWGIWWACMAVYVVVQCIQDLFLTPKIMGKAMGLNPALILLSLSVWGTLLGFIGLIIALPLTTLLLSYFEMYLSSRNDGETPQEKDDDVETVDKALETPES